MSYTTPVTDRTAADLLARNSKAFFNVADWTRIYNNAELVAGLIWVIGDDPQWESVATIPTITTIPVVADFNTLTGNIERTRLAALNTDTIPGISTEIETGYTAGASYPTFNYRDVNLWESTLDTIWDFYDGANYGVCPTLAASLTVLTGINQIYIDCLDADTFDIDLQDAANLIIL